MARPIKRGMDYFPHDVNAAQDEKLEALRAHFGNDGYAAYFICLERIYNSPNAELPLHTDTKKLILAKKIGVDIETFDKILEVMFDAECFCLESFNDRKVLTSNSIKRRAKVVYDRRERQRGPVIDEDNSDIENNPKETPQSKGKKTKANKTKVSLPDNFTVTKEMREWFDNYPKQFTIDIDIETDKFKNHALSKNLKYVLWGKTWENWMLNGQGFAGGFPKQKQITCETCKDSGISGERYCDCDLGNKYRIEAYGEEE